MNSELNRNLPGNPNWVGSFYEKLTEYGEWDIDEFWKLHSEIIEISVNSKSQDKIDRALAANLVTLLIKVLNLIEAHFNIKDVFRIENLDDDSIFNYKERFVSAVNSVFSGEVLPESSFTLTNPLIYSA